MSPKGRRPRVPRGHAGCTLSGVDAPASKEEGQMAEETVKYLLSERDIPAQWVNLLVDLPGEPLPPLSPGRWSRRARPTSRRSSRWG